MARPGSGDQLLGSWCAPCRAEAPLLEAGYRATRELGVAFLGVDVSDTRDAARSFVADFGISYPSLFDPAGDIAPRFLVIPPRAVPVTVVLDRRHRVAIAVGRALRDGELVPAVRAVVAERF
ncbi:TlpA family protein disulfide reductase [Fodinicola feengrottensis]|uniref:TlpA family protein disulfide reductase n=1 Tax=Fodinicola feengrottensis TaxID=435914 RepID=UPI0013D156D3|nr:TlpA disulfide reductase family protein [Fodinicola feengrottensis]